jgi:YHS domain-containing protein
MKGNKRNMKKMNSVSWLVLALMITALSLTGYSQGAKKTSRSKAKAHKAHATQAEVKFRGISDGVESCPVTGEKIASRDVSAKMFDRDVYFCCEGCKAKAEKNPAMFVKKTLDEQRAAIQGVTAKADHHGAHGEHHGSAEKGEQKFLGKGDGVTTCPVTGEPINKNVNAQINGKTVYACCPDCLETVRKNPDLYLKKAEQ